MTIQELIASFKCHQDYFIPPLTDYDEGSKDAWELAIEEAEKLKKSMVEVKAEDCICYSMESDKYEVNAKTVKLYAVEVEEKL